MLYTLGSSPASAVSDGKLRIAVLSDDVALARAVARATRTQVRVEVEVAADGSFDRPSRRHLQLRVRREEGRVIVTLSAGAEGRVGRTLPLTGAPNELDVAEAVALLLPELLDGLDPQRAPEASQRAPPAPRALPVAPSPPAPAAPAAPIPPPPPALAQSPPAPPAPSVKAPSTSTLAPALRRPDPAPTPSVFWLLSATPGALLGRGGLTSLGIDLAAEIFSGGRIGWFGRLSVGAYPLSSLGSQDFAGLSLFPLAAVIGARLRWWRAYSSLGIGGELLIAAAGGDSGEVTALTLQADSGVYVARRIVLGVRLTGSFASGSNQFSMNNGQQVSVPNLFLRCGLFVGVEFP